MIRRPPRSTQSRSSAASDVYKRQISADAFDGRGNYSLGLREQLVFPEINYDKIDRIRGMEITIVTTAPTDAEGYQLLRHLGMPFRGR